MNGLGRQLEDADGSGESIERVLNAIEFQTAILTLNAVVEAASTAEPGSGSPAFAGEVGSVPGNNVGTVAGAGTAASRQAEAFAPIAGPTGSMTQTDGNCGAAAAHVDVQARLWRDGLERLGESLAAACGPASIDTEGRPQAENASVRPAAAPDAVTGPRRRVRRNPAQFDSRDGFGTGP